MKRSIRALCGLGLLWSEYGVTLLESRRVTGGLSEISREGVFFLPDRRLLSPRLTLRQHLDAAGRARRDGLDPGPATVLETDALLDSRPAEMSGGERRRAEIRLAVAAGTACLIADEPLLGIAPADRSRVAAALRARAASGTAILVTGHEVEDLFDLADEVIWPGRLTGWALPTRPRGTPSSGSSIWVRGPFRRDPRAPGGRLPMTRVFWSVGITLRVRGS